MACGLYFCLPILVYSCWTKSNEINIIFLILKNIFPSEYDINWCCTEYSVQQPNSEMGTSLKFNSDIKVLKNESKLKG